MSEREAEVMAGLAKLSPRDQRSEIIKLAVAIIRADAALADTARPLRGTLSGAASAPAYRKFVCELLEGLVE